MHVLHERAQELARAYKNSESALLVVLMEMQAKRLFTALHCTGIFEYCTKVLKLGEAQAQYFKRVAEKSKEVPALKEAIENGEISLSQGRRIVPVITKENSQTWIEAASTMKQRELEAKVAEHNPKATIRENIKPVAPSLREMRVGLTPEQAQMLEKIKDLLSQKTGKAASLQDAIAAMAQLYLEKHDPVRKAEKASSRKSRPTPQPKPGRQPIRTSLKHQVHRRDGFQCTATDSTGHRCDSKRWLHLHHRTFVSAGGTNELPNLTTLCSAHHRMLHDVSKPRRQ